MEIPFALHFLKKVELFQVLKKLDRQFNEQFKSVTETVPVWEVEKKILFWTYKHHKHLGSPILVDELRSKKSFALGKIRNVNLNSEKSKIESMSSNEFEENFKTIVGEWLVNDLKNIGLKKKEVCISPQESEKVGIREAFGNLVSRGYARYFPEVSEEFSHLEKETETMFRHVNKKVSTTQSNCEGIIVTKEGLLMGELINNLYKLNLSGTNDTLSKYVQLYKNKTGADSFLIPKRGYWYFYEVIIYASYGALLIIIWLIMKGLYSFLLDVVEIFKKAMSITHAY